MFRSLLAICIAVLLTGCSEKLSVENVESSESPPIKINNRPSAETVDEISAVNVRETDAALTLRDALSLTVMNNPVLKAYSYEVRAAEARQLQAGLWNNPEFKYELEDFGGNGDFKGTDSAESTIGLSQLIQLGDKIKKRERTFMFSSRLAEMDYDASRLDVFADLTESFVETLFIQEKEALSKELVELSKQIKDSVEKRVSAGKDAPLELSKAVVKLANARIENIEITKQVAFTRKNLTSFWQNLIPVFSTATGSLDEITKIEDITSLENLLDNNPDVARWAIEVEKRDAERDIARAKAIPDLTIAGGIKRIKSTNDNAYVIGLSIPIPVFDRNQGGRLEAMQNLLKTKEKEKAVYLSVRNQLNQLHAELESTQIKISIFRDTILGNSEDLFNASKMSYDRGKIGYLSLLDSQRIYFASKNEYIDTLAKYHILKTRLMRLIGRDITAQEK